MRREQGKTTNGTPTKLSTSERALHLKARELLTGEISVTRGLDQAEADAWIDDQLAAAEVDVAQILRRGDGVPHFERPRRDE